MSDESVNRVVLPGSHRISVEGAIFSEADPNEVFQVSVAVRRMAEPPPEAGPPVPPESYIAAHGAGNEDLLAISQFAKLYGLNVVESSSGKRIVRLEGKLEDFERAFAVNLARAETAGQFFRHRTGEIWLPKDLDGIVVAVLGLDNRPQVKPHSRTHDATTGQAEPFSPLEVASLYQFPAGTGTGATIAILEFGGGYRTTDFASFFSTLGLPPPTVSDVLEAGVTNSPGVSPNSDIEVTLDIEVAAALAPSAQILVYFASNNDQGFLWALSDAIHATPSPTVVSISWGGPEASWTKQTLQALNGYILDAAQLGIPVAVAAGDNGSTDGTSGLAVDFPSSSPNALSCGGTHLVGTGSVISSETVWNGNGATGGGFSTDFAKPSYQTGVANVTGTQRGVPDVAGNADPSTGYSIYVDGKTIVVGGTSAVAPLWAGLIARFAGSRVAGFLNPTLYSNQAALRDITVGNNAVKGSGGLYNAGPGWDACTGLGSPNGIALAKLI